MGKEVKRVCQSCKTLKNRDLMIKITKLNDNTLKINPQSGEIGRSAYICKSEDCIRDAIRKKRLKRALKCSLAAEISRIEEELKGIILQH